MSTPLLHVLDWAFFVFHTALVLFNLFGWMHPRTRRLNLATLLLTGFSWFVMGMWHGVGYCVCTEWHWQVRAALGYHDTATSYIQFLVQTITPLRLPDETIRTLCAIGFAASLFGSLVANARDISRDHPLRLAR